MSTSPAVVHSVKQLPCGTACYISACLGLFQFTLLSWRLLPETQPTHPRVPSDLPPQPQKTRGRELATSEPAGQDRRKAAASALYVSEKFQELLKANEPTLEEWLDFELKVAPASDVLQPLQR